MKINYKFIPENKTTEYKYRADVISYAGRLLEIVDSRTVVVTLDNDDVPLVFECSGRLVDALDVELSE